MALAAPGPVTLRPHASGFSLPVGIEHAGDGSGRLFVVEQGGRIRIVRAGQVLATPFLDLAGIVQAGGEQGLLGLAFHPDYAANGRFFVYYNKPPAITGNAGSDIVIARYLRSAGDPDGADPASGAVLLTIPHPDATNHNGGKIAFGPDGYLYIAVGDGGGGGDPFNAAQNLNDLRGKILRIDVNSGSPYAIPPTNPFVNRAGARGEIFAYGLRNPWRFSFDRLTGDLVIADVGQGAWEEVDFIAAGSPGGQNFGWSVFEGTHCFNPSTNCSLAGHVPPILEYGHDSSGGFSITGGYRYRGRNFRELFGHYVYGDYVSGRLWAAEQVAGGSWATTQVGSLTSVSTFGEDEEGELYAANHTAGTILRFAPPDTDGDGMSDAFESQFFGSATAGDPAADGDGDGIPNLHEYRERTDPALKDNDVFANARLFAMQQYRDFLAREAEPGGLAFWTEQVSGGARSPGQVIESFFSSPEFQGTIAPVERLYFAYFLRVPDYSGLNYWIGQYRTGMSLESISNHFAQSPEFSNRYGTLSNAQFVELVYNNVLGRAPDPGGRAFWTGELDAGARTRGQVMLGFSESPEYRANSGNEVFVTMMYLGMLRRAPEPGGFEFWLDYVDGGSSGLAVIDGFFRSSEYRGRFLP